jgi:hypothetical protein
MEDLNWMDGLVAVISALLGWFARARSGGGGNMARVLIGTALLGLFVDCPEVAGGALMGMNLDLVSFSVTAPGAGPTAMAAVTGDPNTIRNSRAGSHIALAAMWTNSQAVGFTRLTYPSGHDLNTGWTYRNLALTPVPPALGAPAYFKPQDPLTLVQSGSAVAGDVETAHMLLWYEDLPGVDARLINKAKLFKHGVNLLSVQNTIAPTAASAYSGQVTLVAAADTLKPNTDYAILGATFGANCGAFAIQGVFNGGLRCGIPGTTQQGELTGQWFVRLSEELDLPMIPVFNSADRAGVLLTTVTNELLTAVPFSLNLVQLERGVDTSAKGSN